MRVILATGAVLLVENLAQAQAIPPDVVLEPSGENDADGRQVFRELNPAQAAITMMRQLAEELKVATLALDVAAEQLRNGSMCRHCGKATINPVHAANAHRAARRASEAHLALAQP